MSLHAKIFLSLLAGGLAGTLVWDVTEFTGWLTEASPGYGACFGGLLGLLLAVVETLKWKPRLQRVRALSAGAAVGAFGGWLGVALGQLVSGLAGDSPGFLSLLLLCSAEWAVVGGVAGVTPGLILRSALLARQGIAGGLLGGCLGGALVALLYGIGIPSAVSRLIAPVLTGALIGFGVALLPNLFHRAWVQVLAGHHAGDEYLIVKPVTTIGSSEKADIRLRGDAGVAPIHVAMEALAAPSRHRLRFVGEDRRRVGTYLPPLVNGQPVGGEQWLADGDTLQIGAQTLAFHEKATQERDPLSRSWNAAPASRGATAESHRYVGQELAQKVPIPPRSEPTPPALDVAPVLTNAPDGVGTRLVCVQGPYAGQSFPLRHAPVTIGRASDRDIALSADPSVSRTHIRLVYQNGRHVVFEDGSSHGAFVNGRRVAAPRVLAPGDLLQLGDSALRYE